MQLRNSSFLGGVKKTLGALRDLKDGLKFTGATKGLDEVNSAAKKFSLAGISDALDKVQVKFGTFSAIGFAALQRLTNSAIDFGKKIAGAMLDPLISGGKKRALNIEQAKFQFQGLGMDVEQSMEDALYAVKGTAFGLDEAAVAASQFGASGIKSGEEMQNALRGISGVAAMAGAGYSDIANVFTKVAGQGRVMGDDLNRLGTRGINAAATLAEFFNKTSDGANKTEADIRAMVTKGEIDFNTFAMAMSEAFGEHATKANETYTGSLSNMRAALARIGAAFYTPHFESMRRIFNALTPVIDDVSDALQPMVQWFERASKIKANNIVKFLEGLDLSWLRIIMRPIVQIFDNLTRAAAAMGKIVGGALRTAFPPATGAQIYAIVSAIRDFTSRLVLVGPTADKVQRTLAGFFAIFGIGWEIVKALASMLVDVFGEIFKGSGIVLDATASFGDFMVSILEAIRAGDGLEKFFGRIGGALKTVIGWLRNFGTFIGNIFSNMDFSVAEKAVDRVTTRFRPLQIIMDAIAGVWKSITGNMGSVWDMAWGIGSAISGAFSSLGSYLYDALSNIDYNAVLDAINTGLFAGLVVIIKKFLGDLTTSDPFEGKLGFLDTIKDAFGGLTDALDQMQTTLKVGTLVLIAGAVALLTGSLVALSMIDSEGMAKGLLGITAMMGQLVAAMAMINGINVAGGSVRLAVIDGGMILLSVAINILASAVRKMSDLDWEELATGLVGVIGLVAALGLAAKLISGHAGGMITAGIGLTILAVAIRILVGAVEDFSALNWSEIAKGLTGVAGLLTALGLFARFGKVGNMGVLSGVGIILLATGIKMLVDAVGDFAKYNWQEIAKGLTSIAGLLGIIAIFAATSGGGASLILTGVALVVIANALGTLAEVLGTMGGMGWEEIAKGLTALAGALAIIAGAMALMTGAIFGAAALYIVAEALTSLAPALQTMGGMGWDEIARGLTVLAGGLVIIAGAMALMTGALPGAAALLVVAAALTVLTPVLQALGQMSWQELLTGLAALAGVFVVLGVAGLVLAPLVPVLLGLGAAIGLLGIGVALAGAGVMLFASALIALSAAGAVGAAGFVAFVGTILSVLPIILNAIKDVLVGVLNIIIEITPLIGEAIKAIILTMIDVVISLTPEVGRMFSVLLMEIIRIINTHAPDVVATLLLMLDLMLNALVEAIPKMVDAGMKILAGFLKGIADNIGDVVNTAVDIVTNFLDAIAKRLPDIIESGVNLIVSFIEGLSTAIDNNSQRMADAGWDLAGSIIQGMIDGLWAGVERVGSAARGVASSAWNAAKSFLGISSPSKLFHDAGRWVDVGFADGMRAHTNVVESASENVGMAAINSMKKSIRGLSDILDAEMDLTPQITPVLDLSDVERDARRVGSLLASNVSIDGAYARAASTEAAYRRNAEALTEGQTVVSETKEIKFEQHNYSPKALSRAEIYRQTRNQLSVIREEFA